MHNQTRLTDFAAVLQLTRHRSGRLATVAVDKLQTKHVKQTSCATINMTQLTRLRSGRLATVAVGKMQTKHVKQTSCATINMMQSSKP